MASDLKNVSRTVIPTKKLRTIIFNRFRLNYCSHGEAEIVSLSRMKMLKVRLREGLLICLCQQELEEKDCSPRPVQ